jgi:hypothetical protein
VIDTSTVVQLLVASEKLGIAEVVKQCCSAIDSLPPDNVMQVVGAACDSGLTDIALLDSKVRMRELNCCNLLKPELKILSCRKNRTTAGGRRYDLSDVTRKVRDCTRLISTACQVGPTDYILSCSL